MKAISLTQPWASLVALGHKKIETRSWTTRYRGPLAIHASKRFPPSARVFAIEEAGLDRLPKRLPLGAIIATATLKDIRKTEEVVNEISGLERRLGDYSPGRYAWMLEDIRVLPDPVPCKGALRLWEFEQ